MRPSEFAIILGNDWMALYHKGKLVVQNNRLSFGDILDGCDIPCDIMEADYEWEYEREKAKTFGFPKELSEIKLMGVGDAKGTDNV